LDIFLFSVTEPLFFLGQDRCLERTDFEKK